MDNSAILNLSQLERAIRNPDRRLKVLRQYLESLPSDADSLRRAVAGRNAEQIADAAHRIKGAAAAMGANSLADASYVLEQSGRDGILDRLEAEYELILAEMARVESAIGGILSPAPASKSALVIDSQKMFVDLLVQNLKGGGIEARGATSISEASVLYEQRRPSLVVLDPLLDPQSGFVKSILDGHGSRAVIAIVDSDEGKNKAARDGIGIIARKADGLVTLLAAVRSAMDPDSGAKLTEGSHKVMLVDDDPRLLSVVGESLRSRGYIVLAAGSGREALRLLEQDTSVEVVLLDVSMPEMGGMEVLRAITSWKIRPGVIMLTGVKDADIAQQAIRQGAFDYITKSGDFQELASSIAACLDHAEYQRQPWWKRLW